MVQPVTQKAVVLARGLGTRMRRPAAGGTLDEAQARVAEAGLKALMPINGRPFLDYIVDALVGVGLRRICLVVAPQAELMREHARRISSAAGVTVECAVQERPLGTADAVLAAEDFVAGEPFVLCNGDNLYPHEALARVVGDGGEGCRVAAFLSEALVERGNISPERVRDFAVIQASAEGRLLRIVEKPRQPDRYRKDGKLWVNMNLYRFDAGIFPCCRRVKPDPRRGEFELTAAVAEMLAEAAGEFRVVFCEEGVFDLTAQGDVAAVERALKGRALRF